MNIVKQITLIIITGLSLSLTGCVTLYKPNAVHSPMLSNKGEGHITTSLGVSGSGLASLQADVAVSNHIGLMTNGMYHYRSSNFVNDTSVSTEKINIYFVEGGLGIFDKFGAEDKMVLQFYTGAGYGKSQAIIKGDETPNPELSADIFSAFVQPGIVFNKKYIDMAVDVRVKFVRLFNIYEYNYESFNWWSQDYRYTTYDQEFVLFEPVFTMTAGGKNLKGLVQAGLTIPIVNADAYFGSESFAFLNAPIFKLNIGVSYAFGKNKGDGISPIQP